MAPSEAALLARLLDFAQTWKRNWNHGGHSVDDRFTAGQGRWDYGETVFEPWLFDRVSAGFRLYALTGDRQWRQQANSDFDWYSARIGADGVFTPRGKPDTKYSYITPFVLRGRDSLTSAHLTTVQRIHDAWLKDFPSVGKPVAPDANMWTEREIGLALEAAVGHCELTGDSRSQARAQALLDQWQAFAERHGGAPLVTYTRHEGGGPGGTTPQDLVTSPWMSALYFQAARRFLAVKPAASAQVQGQVSRYFDWIEGNGGFYSGQTAHPQYAGLVFPAYLAGTTVGEAGPSSEHMAHALDVAGLIAFAIQAKRSLRQPTKLAQERLDQMRATADRDFTIWTRTASYLPKYRVTPPRKFNWLLRGLWELIDIGK